MKRLPPIAVRARPASASDGTTVLGEGHPLVQAIDALRVAMRQWTVVSVVVLGSGVVSVERRAWGAPLCIAAAVVLAILTVIVVSLRQRRRDLAVDLILEGRENVPIPAVRHECERLSSGRTRRALARAFEDITEEVTRPPRFQLRGSRPLYHRAVVARASPELQAIVGLLKATDGQVRGVAQAERMITSGISPLYGWDAAALRDELGRVIDLLGK
jgi:hypothetical protein